MRPFRWTIFWRLRTLVDPDEEPTADAMFVLTILFTRLLVGSGFSMARFYRGRPDLNQSEGADLRG
ncbi:MAG TPA: hypothetical protein VM784_04695 [Actinomycetota bacterium]|nr:hypothetical protein [Actinomycetota bacterium]